MAAEDGGGEILRRERVGEVRSSGEWDEVEDG